MSGASHMGPTAVSRTTGAFPQKTMPHSSSSLIVARFIMTSNFKCWRDNAFTIYMHLFAWSSSCRHDLKEHFCLNFSSAQYRPIITLILFSVPAIIGSLPLPGIPSPTTSGLRSSATPAPSHLSTQRDVTEQRDVIIGWSASPAAPGLRSPAAVPR